jgi:hypothetical protein
MWSLIAVAFGAIVTTYVFFKALLHLIQDSREPPAMGTTIPFLSPILGMMKRKLEILQLLEVSSALVKVMSGWPSRFPLANRD